MATSERYFAFIRGINTGRRRLTNAQIAAPFERLGLTDVEAYQAAGNITFRSDDATAARPERLETAVAESYGFGAPTFVRRQTELTRIIAEQPFSTDELAVTEGRLQVSFLRTRPDGETIAAAQALIPEEDRVTFSGREWYWLPRRGLSDSRLPVSSIEGLVGPMTIRTIGTLSRMLSKYLP